MAVPFCKLRPELRTELAALRGVMTDLRYAVVERVSAPRPVCGKPNQRAQFLNIRALDVAYSRLAGQLLTKSNAPAYAGPDVVIYRGSFGDNVVAAKRVKGFSLGTLERMRAGKSTGLIHRNYIVPLHYFASIWPADAPWPDDIPRPFTPEKG